MKKLKVISFIFICVYFSQSVGQQRFNIDKNGRSIQVDGFLLEWQDEDSDTFETFIWDAINTPSGLAGYIRYLYKDSCSRIAMKIYPQMESTHRYITMIIDTTISEPSFYAVDRSVENGDTSVTAEWLIPWDSMSIDSAGQYKVGLVAYNACDDTLKPLILYGRRFIERKDSVINRRIMIQFITIAILLMLFLILRSKAKSLRRR